jgi:contractile injection system tube protein
MSDAVPIERAKFTPITGQGAPIDVHFNPASLQYAVTNTLKEEGSGNKKKQFVTQSTGKLTMDLVFDTTHEGQDVRVYTENVAKFMEPVGGSGGGKHAPAVVEFEWGTYAFRGMVESYKETIDFFAPNGVPLRATINLTLSRQDNVFEPGRHAKFDTQGGQLEPVQISTGAGDDATSVAARAGDPRGGRPLAALNGAASMRFAAGASLTVDASVTLGPPVAFASGGAGIGVSGGFGVGIAAGGGLGVAATASLGATAAAGITFGGGASAGVSASAGAFAGLRAPAPPRATLDVERLLPRSESTSVGTDANASFSLGGQAQILGSTSLSVDVGASASLLSRIRFDED